MTPPSWLYWPDDGASPPPPGPGTLLQRITSEFTGANQINDLAPTFQMDGEEYIDISLGAERVGAFALRFWNGSKALNYIEQGDAFFTSVGSGRNRFTNANTGFDGYWGLMKARVSFDGGNLWTWCTIDGSEGPIQPTTKNIDYVNLHPQRTNVSGVNFETAVQAVNPAATDFYAGLPVIIELYLV